VSVRALGRIGIEARDLERWAWFAANILGLPVAAKDPDGSLFLQMDDWEYRVAVHPGQRDDIAYLGWDVDDAAALNRLVAKLRAGGHAVETASTALCGERRVKGLAFCHDPNGIRNEFSYGPRAGQPFMSPRSLSGFVTGDQGVGHVVLVVDDPAAALHFYRDMLGLRLSDFIEFEREPGVGVHMTFMHCNARHHSLAFMSRPGAPRRLSHLMLEARSIDDVGTTFTLCEREGIPIAMTLGRHINDDMFSFYLVTPSGFNIEFGFGGKSIDDATWQITTYDATSVWGHRRIAQPAPSLSIAPTPEESFR
jgi:2,3-dihydroxybiphenyl 1,2-dioxygenase